MTGKERPIDRAVVRAKALGMNKSAFAKRMDVPPQHVTNWIRRGMPPEHHAKAASVLQWSVDELLERTASTSEPQPIWPFKVPFSLFAGLTPDEKIELEEIIEDRIARFKMRRESQAQGRRRRAR